MNYKSETYTLTGAQNKSFLADVSLPLGNGPFPLIVFSHGFKGFKDWGFNTYLPEYFASKGFAFIKFNFSHNGVSIDKSDVFDDLDSFGENNFTKADTRDTKSDGQKQKLNVTALNECRVDAIFR